MLGLAELLPVFLSVMNTSVVCYQQCVLSNGSVADILWECLATCDLVYVPLVVSETALCFACHTLRCHHHCTCAVPFYMSILCLSARSSSTWLCSKRPAACTVLYTGCADWQLQLRVRHVIEHLT